jgi:hypothetical protein
VLRCTPTTLLSGPFLDLLTRALRRRLAARASAVPS